MMVFDLTCLATRNANIRSRISASVGARLVATFSVMSSTTALSRLCTSNPPATVFGGVGRDDDFGEDFGDGLCRFRIQCTVQRDNAAIGRGRIAGERPAVGGG